MTDSTQLHFHTYDREFAADFDPAAITDAEPVRASVQTIKVSTPDHDAYLTDLGIDPANKGSDDPDIIKQMYRVATELGIFVPTPVFGPDWVITKDFTGKDLSGGKTSVEHAVRDRVPQETFMWDCAKLLPLGYWDNGVNNLLLHENGEFRHIDIQSTNYSLYPNLHEYIFGTKAKFKELGFSVSTYRKYERQVLAIAGYLSGDNVQAELPSTVEANVQTALNLFPIEEKTESLDDIDIPTIDNNIVPPKPYEPPEFTIPLAELPTCVQDAQK